jgi:hypothetical protein
LDISSNVLFFQKNPSWLEVGLDFTVISCGLFRGFRLS